MQATFGEAAAEALVKAGKSAINSLRYVETLCKTPGCVFSTFEELVWGVIQERKKEKRQTEEILKFLQNPSCKLIGKAFKREKIGLDDASRILRRNAGEQTLLHLWTLDSLGKSFESLSDLAFGLEVAVQSSKLQPKYAHRLKTLQHLLRTPLYHGEVVEEEVTLTRIELLQCHGYCWNLDERVSHRIFYSLRGPGQSTSNK